MEKLTLSEIECPVCFEYMTSPIMICIRGHNVCGNCKSKLKVCPTCRGNFGSQNRALEVVATKVNELCVDANQNNTHSAFDLLDKYKKRNTISEIIGEAIVNELKCKYCELYTFSPIYICCNGHSTCKKCRKCSKCSGNATCGRNFALERIVNVMEYPCPYKKFGCSFILTTQQVTHEKECEYRCFHCPLSEIESTTCAWSGTLDALKLHLLQSHVSCKFYETPYLILNIMYTSNSVVFTMGKIFVISVVIKNGKVYYRTHVTGPKDDASRFRGIHTFLLNETVIETVNITPSPHWLELTGGMFMDIINSKVALHVSLTCIS